MKRWLSNILIVLFVMVFLVSGFFLGRYWLESRKQKGQFDELTQIMEQARPAVSQTPQQNAPEDSTEPSQEATEPVSELVSVIDPQTGLPVQVLPEYAALYELNSDLVGWISIPDTNIHYPVLQTPDRTDHYLYRDFYGQDSTHGCIYVREACDVFTPSDNVVIYGHRMKDGSMFHDLLHYEKQSYYEAHKYIEFNTLTERHTYEIMAVFKTVATESGFDYHLFINAFDERDFADFVADCKALSLYDTGISAQYGDKLITLSTCEYSQDNGRMVVVARRIG